MKKKLTFEDYLMEQHALQFIGTKDMMIDDFPNWLESLEFDDWFSFGDSFGVEKAIESIDRVRENLNKEG